MTSNQSHQPDSDSIQLALNIPGFDFAPPQKKPGTKPVVIPQIAQANAGQLTIQLDN